MPRLTALIAIGQVVAPFGVQGELKVRSLTGDPARFLKLRRVFLPGPEDTGLEYLVHRVRLHKGHALLTLAGVRGREAAEALVRRYLYIATEDREPLAEGEHYVVDLIGLAVELTDGTPLGTLDEIIETGANDVYLVSGPEGRYLIPATREAIAEVNLETRTMRVHPLPGLLDLKHG